MVSPADGSALKPGIVVIGELFDFFGPSEPVDYAAFHIEDADSALE